MNALEEKCTIILIIASLLVLAINYGHLTGEILNFSLGPVAISNVEASQLLILAASIGILAALSICHVKTQWPKVHNQFSYGYRNSSPIKKIVEKRVTEAVEDSRYGAPVGNIKGTLFPKSQNIGSFITRLGAKSNPVIVSPSLGAHVSAFFSGFRKVFGRGLWLGIHLPFLLGVWALGVVVV